MAVENIGHLGIRKRIALEAFRHLENQQAAKHELRQLFWECTLRCNLHCRHCGSDCHQQALQPDMPLNDFLRVLDSVAHENDPHKVFIIFTGGEPLMRRDLEDCVRAVYERGFPSGMVTNGMLLTRERFHRLYEAGLHTATVSLDGLEADHNWMRGHALSHARAVEAIQVLAEQKGDFVFDVVTCANQRNFSSLPQLRDFLIDMGVKRWRIFSVFPAGRAASDDNMQLTPQQMHQLMHFIRDTRREGRIRLDYGCEGFLGRYEGDVRDHFFTCQAGITVGSVLADGSISACPSIRADYHQGNIYQDDFMDTWNNRFLPYRDREWMRKGECADCKFFRYCRGNGMHLRDAEGNLMLCRLKQMATNCR